MQCPVCNQADTRVLDSRDVDDGLSVRRRRECSKCAFRFSTMEEMEILHLKVIKNNGNEQPYDREKMVTGLKKALEKRPIAPERFKVLVHRIERDVQLKAENDTIKSQSIGEIVVKHLRRVDKIAYIRFASVYHHYTSLEEFEEVLRELQPKLKMKAKN